MPTRFIPGPSQHCKAMQSMIDNLINGNLSDARKQSRKYTQSNIIAYCLTELGWSDQRAYMAAHYLKTREGWQQYCDAK